jgi:hypothetical protein
VVAAGHLERLPYAADRNEAEEDPTIDQPATAQQSDRAGCLLLPARQ